MIGWHVTCCRCALNDSGAHLDVTRSHLAQFVAAIPDTSDGSPLASLVHDTSFLPQSSRLFVKTPFPVNYAARFDILP